jgi:hypothetical protein
VGGRAIAPLNLIKLCVGADSPEDLRAWRARRAAEGRAAIVHTRQTPKRAPMPQALARQLREIGAW